MSDNQKFLANLLKWGKEGLSRLKAWIRIKNAKIKRGYQARRNRLIKQLKSDDVKFTVKAVFTIIMDGLLISLGMALFVPFSWFNILIFGAGWYIFKTQIREQISKLLASFTLIKIGK